MNIALWIVQILLALHTAVGGVWKFLNSAEKTMPTLKAIPDGVWRGMGAFEFVVSVCLVAPMFYRPLHLLVPIAAACVALEMLVFCGLHLQAGGEKPGPMVYWLVVAAVSAFVCYGRFSG